MFLTVLQHIFNSFGAPILVPVVIYIISLILKVSQKKAFMSAVLAGVGLEGFTMLLNAFTPIIAPVVQKMVHITGINLPGVDVGWQSAALIAYATQPGMIFLALGIIVQTVLFLIKWTDVFQPSDLWNNYSYAVWGSMVFIITKNMILAIGLMVLLNMYSLLIAELMARRWSKYYQYPGCTIVSMHNIEPALFGVVTDPVLNVLGLNKVKVNPESLQKRLGFLGEPVTLGLFLGLIIGILGNLKSLNTITAWGSVALVGIATSAVMAIFPRIAGIFAQAFLPMTEGARKSIKQEKNKDREWFLGINDAAGFGEQATLLSGILLIPIMVVIAMVLPGNKVLPLVDLVAIPFMCEGLVAIANGNIVKVIVNGVIWFSLGLYMCSYTAPLFTEVAKSVGIALPAGAVLITSFNILGKPLMGLVFLAFLSQNPILIGITVIVYFVLWFLLRKFKPTIYTYLDRQANKNMQQEAVEATGISA